MSEPIRVDAECHICHAKFMAVKRDVERGYGRYCSRRCAALAAPRSPEAVRFWAKVDKDNGPILRPELGRCWLWTGARMHPEDYGKFSVNGRWQHAHRVSYRMAYGPVPDGLWVLHRCDNPPCINPAHLFVGDQGANVRDMVDKGRAAVGERNGASRLTPEVVAAIRSRYVPRRVSQARLAAEFGVGQTTINKVVRGLTWAPR